MKTLAYAAAAALVLGTSAAMAGGVPVTPAEVVIVDTGNSNGGILVPVMFLLMAGAALLNN